MLKLCEGELSVRVVCHVVRLYSVVDIVVISGDVVCCSVVCGTMVGVSVFSIMCSELLIMPEISWPLWPQYASTRVLSVRSHHL